MRGMKLALAASVALNVFLIAGGVALWFTVQEGQKTEQQHRQSRSEMVMELVSTRSPEVAEPIKARLRDIALTARPDFQEARAARRAAIDRTESDDFDAAEVAGLLEQSRASEMRGRARLEAGAVAVLADQAPEDRKALARILSRHHPHAPSPKKPAQAQSKAGQAD